MTAAVRTGLSAPSHERMLAQSAGAVALATALEARIAGTKGPMLN